MGSDEKTDVVQNFLISSDRLGKMLREYFGSNQATGSLSDDEMKQAAYALNMCTVSVSQIIDYKDINVLEQEYEAILNNLNLEHMPKDDALLHILRQILDTITYFRIEEGDKEMIEKEYQQKMKNAIWSAVPNFGLLLAGGNPLTMSISLASQIGIGYMNYRRNKAETTLNHEEQLWQLQRTAIEQFNGLRRELFDTAWRLADTYNFPDKYRLTEKQIRQYNKILMDSDEFRKYERLEAIKDKFEAYPPFWYFIGNSANYIAGNTDINISEKTRDDYRAKAKEYFEKYENLNRFNILREDQLAASCALEHIDLLLSEKKPDENRINKLLKLAVDMSGNSFDILELCAITYLKINKLNEAAKILKILVNEGYNKIINAQLLSSIYVKERNNSDYEVLATRVSADYLYPMPTCGENVEMLDKQFNESQKQGLKGKYCIVSSNFLQKYNVEWNRITSVFEAGAEYPDTFFCDNDIAKLERKNQALRVFSERAKKEQYLNRMANTNYELNLLSILNEMFRTLFDFKVFANLALQSKVEEMVKDKIEEKRKKVNELQTAMVNGTWSLEKYLDSQNITLDYFVEDALKELLKNAYYQINVANINDIAYMDGDLREFCSKNGIPESDAVIGRHSIVMFEPNKEIFGPELFGAQAVRAKKNADFHADMTSFIKEKMNSVNISTDDAVVYYSGDSGFNGYFDSVTFENHSYIKAHAIMVIKDKSRKKTDLIFTTYGVVDVVKDKVRHSTPYDEVKLKGEVLLLYNRAYKNPAIDSSTLFNLIKDLGNKFVEDGLSLIREVLRQM